MLAGAHYSVILSPRFSFSQERGGIMSLTEVYCLVNRARGMEVSTEYLDLLLLKLNTDFLHIIQISLQGTQFEEGQ